MDSDREHATAAKLELLTALRGHGSHLRRHDWDRLLAGFDPRTRRVVILHGLLKLTFEQCGERVGEFGRGRASQLWLAARPKLVEFLREEGVIG